MGPCNFPYIRVCYSGYSATFGASFRLSGHFMRNEMSTAAIIGITDPSFIIDVFITANTFQEGLLLTLVLLLLVGIFAVIFFTLMSKGKLPSKLILRDSTNRSGGFSGVADLSRLNGKSGVALTELRPAGVVTIEGERVDAVTSGAFIDKGTEVSVIEISGRRVVVDTK